MTAATTNGVSKRRRKLRGAWLRAAARAGRLPPAAKLAILVVFFVAVDLGLGRLERLRASCNQIFAVGNYFMADCFERVDIPGLMFTPKPNSRCFPYSRFSDREHSPREAPGTVRILALGDSITHNPPGPSFHVERAWHELLAAKLNADGGPRWEVLNGGVQSYNTEQEYLYYRHFLRDWAPDAVILQYLEINDYLAPMVPGFMQPDYDRCVVNAVPNLLGLPAAWHAALSLRLGSYGFFNRRVYNILWKADPERYPNIFFHDNLQERMVDRNRDAFWRLKAETEAENVALFVVVFPILRDRYERDPWIYETVRRGFPAERLLYLLPHFQQLGSLDKLSDDTVHPKQPGHDVAAREIHKLVKAWAAQTESNP